jgi:hypothetical protein
MVIRRITGHQHIGIVIRLAVRDFQFHVRYGRLATLPAQALMQLPADVSNDTIADNAELLANRQGYWQNKA